MTSEKHSHPNENTQRGTNTTLNDSDITGLKYFSMLSPLLKRLHQEACQRDKAKQRKLHYDQYCMLVAMRPDSG